MAPTQRSRVTHYIGDGCEPAHREIPGTLRHRPGDQPLPQASDREDIQSIVIREIQRYGLPCRPDVIEDIQARRQLGIERYGTALQPFNGRSALLDLYQECLDGTMYARQALEELGGMEPRDLDREKRREWQILYRTYQDLLGTVTTVRMLMNERAGLDVDVP